MADWNWGSAVDTVVIALDPPSFQPALRSKFRHDLIHEQIPRFLRPRKHNVISHTEFFDARAEFPSHFIRSPDQRHRRIAHRFFVWEAHRCCSRFDRGVRLTFTTRDIHHRNPAYFHGPWGTPRIGNESMQHVDPPFEFGFGEFYRRIWVLDKVFAIDDGRDEVGDLRLRRN